MANLGIMSNFNKLLRISSSCRCLNRIDGGKSVVSIFERGQPLVTHWSISTAAILQAKATDDQDQSKDKRNYEDVVKFKSKYSYDNIHPNKNSDIARPVELPKSNEERFTGYIPMERLTIETVRSSAPGGQNVNKTETKVIVSFELMSADWIPPETRHKLFDIHKNSINKAGIWRIVSEKTRSQHLNVADCMDKLRAYITEADTPPPQPSIETLEKRRRSAEKAAARRLQEKRAKSMNQRARKLDILD